MRTFYFFRAGQVYVYLRAAFSPAHPLADIFHPPYPPIASQSISRDVPLARARAFQSSLSLVKGVAKAEVAEPSNCCPSQEI